MTAEIGTTGSAGSNALEQRRTVTRAVDRVHVSLVAQNMEWLFVRNPVDVRRVSGTMVDHRRRTIVEYDESELRSAGLARGWADVVGFGVDPEALQTWPPTGRKTSASGFEFSERRPPPATEENSRELWWSNEAAAPLRVSNGGERAAMVVSALQRGIDASLLLDPRQRFAAYAVMDIADFREALHDHAH